MRLGLRFLLVPLAVLGAAPAVGAQPVFRCLAPGGKVAFQAVPCEQGATETRVKLRDDAPATPAAPRQSAWKGYTPPKVAAMTFYYDPKDEPVGFSSAQMEADLQAAIAAWNAGCNVRLAYGGRRPARLPGTPEHVPVRWAPEYMRLAHPADARSGIAGTGSLSSGIALKPRFHEGHMLSVLIHEMGHVLGLPHKHEDPQSIMSYLRDEAARRQPRPSAGDYDDCNASMHRLFGVDHQPAPDAAAAARPPRMTDREALERIHGAPRR
ncbi:DUF4124 domain-containing protein [Ramlibacter pallidus]|uniref:Matrixin family metalloprotease n=1 Tax=Ramlibacter pallidus TaxID=2780087 RepID=A0ABR9S7R0_9BURK|nr:DUF4124 domain-containing protein [Ramlibacter pallidus]MBE7369464.1 hypothetical protein [Ramlibacter pallidus]